MTASERRRLRSRGNSGGRRFHIRTPDSSYDYNTIVLRLRRLRRNRIRRFDQRLHSRFRRQRGGGGGSGSEYADPVRPSKPAMRVRDLPPEGSVAAQGTPPIPNRPAARNRQSPPQRVSRGRTVQVVSYDRQEDYGRRQQRTRTAPQRRAASLIQSTTSRESLVQSTTSRRRTRRRESPRPRAACCPGSLIESSSIRPKIGVPLCRTVRLRRHRLQRTNHLTAVPPPPPTRLPPPVPIRSPKLTTMTTTHAPHVVHGASRRASVRIIRRSAEWRWLSRSVSSIRVRSGWRPHPPRQR